LVNDLEIFIKVGFEVRLEEIVDQKQSHCCAVALSVLGRIFSHLWV